MLLPSRRSFAILFFSRFVDNVPHPWAGGDDCPLETGPAAGSSGCDCSSIWSTVKLNLDWLAETEAILADGSKVVIETFLGFASWFGTQMPVQVIANEGRFPLLGTELLAGRELLINYRTAKIRLT